MQSNGAGVVPASCLPDRHRARKPACGMILCRGSRLQVAVQIRGNDQSPGVAVLTNRGRHSGVEAARGASLFASW